MTAIRRFNVKWWININRLNSCVCRYNELTRGQLMKSRTWSGGAIAHHCVLQEDLHAAVWIRQYLCRNQPGLWLINYSQLMLLMMPLCVSSSSHFRSIRPLSASVSISPLSPLSTSLMFGSAWLSHTGSWRQHKDNVCQPGMGKGCQSHHLQILPQCMQETSCIGGLQSIMWRQKGK